MTATTLSINGAPPPARDTAEPPTIECPYWRGPNGERSAFSELVAGRDPDRIRELSELHVQAICALVRAGLAARSSGDDAEARRLLAAAARLCDEPVGHWPAAAMRSDD